jgi:Xaa-Pro aminopeptidase
MNYIHRDENAIYYECGYSCDNALYLSLGSESYFFTDSRYEIDAKINIKDSHIIITRDLIGEAIAILKKSKIKKLTLNPSEFSYAMVNKITEYCKLKLDLVPNLSQQKRIIKSKEEIKKLTKAVKLGAKAFDHFAKWVNHLGIGESESSINYNAKMLLSDMGKYDLSFDPITAIAKQAALPHATPTKRRLKKNDLLLVDAGLKYQRYCSDRTRTVMADGKITMGHAQKFKSAKIQKAYDTVLKSHDKAIEKIRVGMRASEIDKIARDVIKKSPFAGTFIHSTGHGVGLDIHELPVISAKSETVIEEGMVFTIEPGVYLEDQFGIRIEDMVVIKNGRAVVL